MTPIPLTLLLHAGSKAAGSTVPAWVAIVAALIAALVSIVVTVMNITESRARENKRLEVENAREATRVRTEKEREATRLEVENAREATRVRTEKEREANRQNHERELKKTDLQHQRQLEERRDRLQIYRNMAIAARTLGVTERIHPEEPGGRTDLAEALAEVQIVSPTPKVLKAAESLTKACSTARREAARAHDDMRIKNVEEDPEVDTALKKARRARGLFLDAARVELGLQTIENKDWKLLET
jgi:uncharacterized membrane protein YgaE (UPF0421/DUF939 family)